MSFFYQILIEEKKSYLKNQSDPHEVENTEEWNSFYRDQHLKKT